MNKVFTAIIIVLSLISVPDAFSQTRKKQPAKAPAKSAKAKAPAKNTKTKTPAKKQANSRNDRNARNSRNSRNDRNARNSRNSRNDRSSRSSRNSRNDRNARSSRTAPSTVRASAPAPAPKVNTAAFSRELIVSAPIAPIRGRAASDAPYVANAKLGTVLFGAERDPQWHRVQYSVNGKTNTGWIQNTSVTELNGTNRAAVYRQIVGRNPEASLDFTGAVAMYDFLTRVGSEVPSPEDAAELELGRVVALRRAVSAIRREDRNFSPYVDFLRTHDGDVLFNDATGSFVVSSNLFWNVAEKFKGYPAGDDIAWTAARNPLPGSCGQSLSCALFNLRMTDGEYLAMHPNGRRAAEAAKNLSMMLQPIVADLGEKSLFKVATDQESKDELNSLVAELKTIVNRTSAGEKAAVVEQLGKISAAYK